MIPYVAHVLLFLVIKVDDAPRVDEQLLLEEIKYAILKFEEVNSTSYRVLNVFVDEFV